MKKTYYQSSIILIPILLLLFIIAVGCLYCIIRMLTFLTHALANDIALSTNQVVICIITVVCTVFWTFAFLRVWHNNIHIKNNIVFMRDDWCGKNTKIQYATKVDVTQIKTIDIIWTPKNSKMKTIPNGRIADTLPKAYLSFETLQGEKKNMLILYLGAKNVRRLINDIKKIMAESGNFSPIEDTDLLVAKYTAEWNFKRKKNHR